MFQVDQPTAVSSLPTPAAAGTPGFFTNGNPVGGIPATILEADFTNMLMMELLNVVTGAGLTPSKTTYTQVLAAIKRIGQSTVVLADTGAANAYSAVNATPLVAGTWVDGVVQAVKIAHANTGPSTYAPDGLTAIPIYGLGLQALQGGELTLNGTAILMHTTIASVNGGNPICVLMECAGGAQQIPPATQPLHAVQFGQISGVVGQARNLVSNVGLAATTKPITADEIILEIALGGLRYCLSNLNLTGNLATQMDTGSAPVSGFVAEYVIYNPNAAISATNPRLLYTNATSAVQPNVYGGANMPAGYTASALSSVWQTNGSGQFVSANQLDRTIAILNITVITTGTTASSITPLVISAAVPKNAKSCSGFINATTTGFGGVQVPVYSTAGGAGLQNLGGYSSAGTGVYQSFNDLLLPVPQTMYYTTSPAGSGTSSYGITISKYTF